MSVYMCVCICETPLPLLHSYCRRIIFDMEKLDRVKVTDRFEFPLVLDMAPFVENGELDVARGTANTAAQSDASPAGVTPELASTIHRRMVWLSDLSTPDGRAMASAVSDSLNSREDIHNVSMQIEVN